MVVPDEEECALYHPTQQKFLLSCRLKKRRKAALYRRRELWVKMILMGLGGACGDRFSCSLLPPAVSAGGLAAEALLSASLVMLMGALSPAEKEKMPGSCQ